MNTKTVQVDPDLHAIAVERKKNTDVDGREVRTIINDALRTGMKRKGWIVEEPQEEKK